MTSVAQVARSTLTLDPGAGDFGAGLPAALLQDANAAAVTGPVGARALVPHPFASGRHPRLLARCVVPRGIPLLAAGWCMCKSERLGPACCCPVRNMFLAASPPRIIRYGHSILLGSTGLNPGA